MESEYNSKNRQRSLPMDDRPAWDEIFGAGKVYAVSTGRVCWMDAGENLSKFLVSGVVLHILHN